MWVFLSLVNFGGNSQGATDCFYGFDNSAWRSTSKGRNQIHRMTSDGFDRLEKRSIWILPGAALQNPVLNHHGNQLGI